MATSRVRDDSVFARASTETGKKEVVTIGCRKTVMINHPLEAKPSNTVRTPDAT